MSYLYSISDPGIKDASKDLLGGKGYGLWKMKQAGVPVPPAYILSTNTCRAYMEDPEAVMAEIRSKLIPEIVEGLTAEFGYMPLVSVRSGAKFSMPGMMDTVLNVGMDSMDAAQWGVGANLPVKCVNDSYARLIEMYGSVVNGIERKKFEGKSIDERILFYKLETGEAFPGPNAQLLGAIEAVFKSWNNERAKTYRKLNNIPDDLGTAVVIQAMVFGNMNDKSGTGVAFSRNYSNGENKVIGDFLLNGQGEDVVAGIRTPEPLSAISKMNAEVGKELLALVEKLETMERDMVDVEFTVQDGKLYILQVRAGKRTAQAAVRIAVDLVEEGVISPQEALARVSLKQFLGATRPVISAKWLVANPPHAVGLPASNGCAVGVAVFSSKDAIDCKEPCILIAEETTPDDIGGMNAAVGILTATGGATSHAAVVARGMDKVCVVGCTALSRVRDQWVLKSDDAQRLIKSGDKIAIDGNSGAVWVGSGYMPLVEGGVANGTMARFFALLEQCYSYYRTVTCIEEMKGAEKLLVASYELDRHSVAKLDERFTAILEAIDGREAIVDLRSYRDLVREADAPLEFLFGDRDSMTEVKVVNYCAAAKSPALANTKVLGLGLSKAQVEALEAAGAALLPDVKDVPSLLAANGVCTADFDALLKVMSRDDVNKIITLKKQSGEVVRSFNIVEEIDPDAIGRNALFALSPMQAAQSFLKNDRLANG